MNRNICALVICMLVFFVSSKGQGTGDNVIAHLPGSEAKVKDMSNLLLVMLTAQGGGGLLSNPSGPTAYGGGKIGFGPAILSMGYDRVQAHNGFSIDGSALVPVFRFPAPQRNDYKNFVRIYAEPGVGHRGGSGQFGGYLTAKAMIALLSNDRLSGDTWDVSPFLEVEHRFPFRALGQGDTRVSFGFMLAISGH